MPRRRRAPAGSWKTVGRLQRSSPRFAFVVMDGGEDDVYVPSRYLAGALDGDEVEVQVRRNRRSGLLEGKVLRVVHRPHRELTGRVSRTRGGHVLLADDPKFPGPILIADGDGPAFTEGDRVVAELDPKQKGEINSCRVTDVLGDAEDARLDSTVIAREFSIPAEFGVKAREEADISSATGGSGTGEAERSDLTELTVFTIDPETAADFDDALSVRTLSRERVEVGVHIADVSSFVDNDSALDVEAMERGNSVYLPDRVFPMLPAALSSDACSLLPQRPRRCVSVVMELTPDGELIRSKVLESTVRSTRRFSYDEVQEILEGRLDCPRGLKGDLKRLSAVAEALKEKRHQRKSLDLEIPEVRARLSDRGLPEELCIEEMKASHSLVEETMILANAVIGSRARAAGIPFIFRVHPKAKKEKIEEFLRAAAVMGVRKVKGGGRDFRNVANRLGDSLDPARKRLLNSLFVRSMEKARYDVSDIGHYGLALEGYCHFTSPIRRYADLMDHRIVKHCMVRNIKKPPRELTAKLDAASQLCSELEVRGDEAEREANKVKALRFMERYLGDVLEGLIVGVVNSGFFVEISGHLVEGMVSKDVLRDDSYYCDEEHFALVGKRRGRRYALGQSVKVQIAKIDPLARMMDLVPVTEGSSGGQTNRKYERQWR